MGINLFFSNLLETLAEGLHEVLSLENRNEQNIFRAPMVIVPNANLKKWIQLHFAQKNGIIFNTNFQYLETGLWQLLELLDPNDIKPKILDLSLRQLLLLHVLENLETNQPDFEPVLHYFQSPDFQSSGDQNSLLDTKRLWQLSEKLSFLFQEYEFHRLKMIHGWMNDQTPSDAMETCQKRIYLEAKKIIDNHFRDHPIRRLSLMEFSREVFSNINVHHSHEVKNRYVHLFGFSNISAFHLDLIRQMGQFFNIFIYSVNPCREFWEDVHTPWEKRRIDQKSFLGPPRIQNDEDEDEDEDEGQLFTQPSHTLLSLWGKAGRENVRTLCHLVDYDFNDAYVLKENKHTVLEKIQNQVFTFETKQDSFSKTSQDTSVQIIACPSRFREVETVYNSILYNLNQDPSFQLTDIAIQVPDISVYKPWIDAVFHRHPKLITYNLVDAQAQIESLYGKAVVNLLELVSGRFSRQEIFGLFLNPCMMEKWNLSVEDIHVFAGWCQALNIFHTFDQNSKTKKGYVSSDMYTWKQGLMRLKLSRIFSEPWDTCEDNKPFIASFNRHFNGKTPYSDTGSGNLNLLEKFCEIVETLHHISEQFCRGPFLGQEWKQKFIAACNHLFAVPSQLNAEKTVQKALFQAIDELCILDPVIENQRASGIDLSRFKEFIKSRLSGIWGGYGDYLTSGVTISALLPMRPLPFRIVYVMGMEEGAFPGKAETSSLDLRLNKPKTGDISLPERNRHLFLELLLSVKEKFYISYVSKDLQKDRVLQPCSVLNQLRRTIESEILLENHPFKIVDVPLKGSSVKYVERNAHHEYSDILVNYSAADRIMYYREKGLWPQLAEKISEEQNKSLISFFPDFSITQAAAPETDFLPEKITARQLSAFLKDPVKQNIRRHLLLYDQEDSVEDMTIFEDEPFYSEYPTSFQLRIEPLRLWIDNLIADSKPDPDKNLLKVLFQKVYANYGIQNKTPEGAFGALDMEMVKEAFNEWIETLSPVLSDMLNAKENLYHALYMGESTDNLFIPPEKMHKKKLSSLQTGVWTIDAFQAPVYRDVQLHGRLPWVWKGHDNNWHCLVLTGSAKKAPKKPDRFIIEPALNYFLACSSESEKEFLGEFPIIFHVAYQNEIRSWSCHVTKDEALDYIRELVAQYLNPCMRQWLPFDEVIKAAKDLSKLCSSQTTEIDMKSFELKLSAALAEQEDPLIHLSGPEIDRYSLQTACDRFGIFFKRFDKLQK